MARYHGITTETYEKFVLDAGAVYADFVDFDNPGTLLGATRGGSTVMIEQEIREMEADGVRGNVDESRRITRLNARITLNLLEHTISNLLKVLPGAVAADFATNWDTLGRSLTISDVDFLSSIAIIGEISGNPLPVGFYISDALADSNFELSIVDKEEGVVTVTFTAHFKPATLESEPWLLLLPRSYAAFATTDNLTFATTDGYTLAASN